MEKQISIIDMSEQLHSYSEILKNAILNFKMLAVNGNELQIELLLDTKFIKRLYNMISVNRLFIIVEYDGIKYKSILTFKSFTRNKKIKNSYTLYFNKCEE